MMFFSNIMFCSKPLEHFEINVIVPIIFYSDNIGFFIDMSLTNFSIFGIISLVILWFINLIVNSLTMIPNNYQKTIEEVVFFLKNDTTNQLKSLNGQKVFNFIFTLFVFILCYNFTGMTGFSFAVTSQLVIDFMLSFTVFFSCIIVGFKEHGYLYLKIFFPQAPLALMPLLVFIEIISFFIKPISLGVRLFANIMAGHTLLGILASFIPGLAQINFFIGVLIFCLILVVTFLELAIAFLQGYVFVILTILYYKESFDGGH